MDVAQRLRREGYRVTQQRELVWDTLRRAERHLTAEELHTRVQRTAPDLNVASVYRTLALLGELDLAREVRIDDGPARWEVAHDDDAFHLVCRRCEAVTHHEGDLVERVRDHLQSGHGFAVESVDLVVHGVCSDCRQG